jgi:hypothetical protein
LRNNCSEKSSANSVANTRQQRSRSTRWLPFFTEQGRETEAEALYERAIAILEKRLGHEHLELVTPINNLSHLYRRQNRYVRWLPFVRLPGGGASGS